MLNRSFALQEQQNLAASCVELLRALRRKAYPWGHNGENTDGFNGGYIFYYLDIYYYIHIIILFIYLYIYIYISTSKTWGISIGNIYIYINIYIYR